jgi:hypothetical protein
MTLHHSPADPPEILPSIAAVLDMRDSFDRALRSDELEPHAGPENCENSQGSRGGAPSATGGERRHDDGDAEAQEGFSRDGHQHPGHASRRTSEREQPCRR